MVVENEGAAIGGGANETLGRALELATPSRRRFRVGLAEPRQNCRANNDKRPPAHAVTEVSEWGATAAPAPQSSPNRLDPISRTLPGRVRAWGKSLTS